MIFCDLDEYLHISKTTLLEEIKHKDKDLFVFCNYWSQTLDNKIPSSLSTFISCSLGLPAGKRSKNILKPNLFDIIGIHYIENQHIEKQKCPNYKMYHFYSWSGIGRKIKIENPEIVSL